MKKAKKFLNNPWTVGIGVALFSFILTFISDIVSGEKIFSTIGTVFTWIWKAILSFLTFDLKVWWVLIGIGVIVFGLWIYSKVLDAKEAETNEPPFLTYSQDTILGYRFEWEWRKDYTGKYSAENIHPICSDCGTPLVRDERWPYQHKCLRCEKPYQKPYPEIENVKMMIHDNVKRKFFSDNNNAN